MGKSAEAGRSGGRAATPLSGARPAWAAIVQRQTRRARTESRTEPATIQPAVAPSRERAGASVAAGTGMGLYQSLGKVTVTDGGTRLDLSGCPGGPRKPLIHQTAPGSRDWDGVWRYQSRGRRRRRGRLLL